MRHCRLLVLVVTCLVLPSSLAQSESQPSTKHWRHEHHHNRECDLENPTCCLGSSSTSVGCREILEDCPATDTPNDAVVMSKLIADLQDVNLDDPAAVCALKQNWAYYGADISSFDIINLKGTTLTLSDQTTVEVVLSRAAVFTARHNVYVVISQIGATSPIVDKLATESYGNPAAGMLVNSAAHQLYKAYVQKGLLSYVRHKADDAAHIVIAGSSAGAMAAQFLALDLLPHSHEGHKLKSVYLEGVERVGNQAFQNFYVHYHGHHTFAWWSRVDPLPEAFAGAPYTPLPLNLWWRVVAGSGPGVCRKATTATFVACNNTPELPCPSNREFHKPASYFCNIKRCVVTRDTCLRDLQVIKPLSAVDAALYC